MIILALLKSKLREHGLTVYRTSHGVGRQKHAEPPEETLLKLIEELTNDRTKEA